MTKADPILPTSRKRAGRRLPVRTAWRYVSNLVAMEARQNGYPAAARAGARFVTAEIAKTPRIVRLALAGETTRARPAMPTRWSPEIVQRLVAVGAAPVDHRIDVDGFRRHMAQAGYPRNYAAGPTAEGGAREKKLLEYFVSFELLSVRPGDVLIDVASERSMFPDAARRLFGATVYQQDLIYPAGIHGDRIGGSAAAMPVPDGFADKLVLHNSFEHFEGTSDTDFIAEAWRVLRPGGLVCIVPLFLSDRYCIMTDPLAAADDVPWDEGAEVIRLPWHHNRFGRFYDPEALSRRVLQPALGVGFRASVYHFVNVTDAHQRATMSFGLVLRKPEPDGGGGH